MTNKIYLLDNVNIDNLYNEDGIVIRLMKKYNITLLNILPPVIENIIIEYIHDIIEITIKNNKYQSHARDIIVIKIICPNQSINCQDISFSYNLCFSSICYYDIEHISNNNIMNIYEVGYSCQYAFNSYMKQFYDTHNYFGYVYRNPYSYYTVVHNHKLFKNMLIIIKHIYENIRKNLTKDKINIFKNIFVN